MDLPRWWETFMRDMEHARRAAVARMPRMVACPDRLGCAGNECAECRNCEIHCTCGGWDE